MMLYRVEDRLAEMEKQIREEGRQLTLLRVVVLHDPVALGAAVARIDQRLAALRLALADLKSVRSRIDTTQVLTEAKGGVA